jgi:hypothetical protein
VVEGEAEGLDARGGSLAADDQRGTVARAEGKVTDTDARLWHPWLSINHVLRVMLHTHWSAEAWSQVRVEFRRALMSHRAQLVSSPCSFRSVIA